jgi:Ca2+:H+ antiporter
VLTPEGLGGINAAHADRMQRAINIFLGSVLATLALTIPFVVILGLLQGKSVVLGLEGTEEIMLALTLLVSLITFTSGRTWNHDLPTLLMLGLLDADHLALGAFRLR